MKAADRDAQIRAWGQNFQNPRIRKLVDEAMMLTPAELEKRGINRETRASYLTGLIVPDDSADIELTKCWRWQKSATVTEHRGYVTQYRRRLKATHVAVVLFHGKNLAELSIAGVCVCHICPSGEDATCVNPFHVVVGDHALNAKHRRENNRLACGDRNGARIHRDRMPRGEDNKSSVLTEEEVQTIRATLAAYPGEVGVKAWLMKKMNVKETTLLNAAKPVGKRTWDHVEDDHRKALVIPEGELKGYGPSQEKCNLVKMPAAAAQLVWLFFNGATDQIFRDRVVIIAASLFKMTRPAVRAIAEGKARKQVLKNLAPALLDGTRFASPSAAQVFAELQPYMARQGGLK